jgi:hypothetical protein
MDYASQINRPFNSHWFLIQASCNATGGCNPPLNSDLIDIPAIEISATDSTPPLVPDIDGRGAGDLTGDLWSQTGRWIRGLWPFYFKASDDSGICQLHETVDGSVFAGSSSTPNTGSWTQCPNPEAMGVEINTGDFPDGPMKLGLWAADATKPANQSSQSETVEVDNAPVGLSLSGPSDALSTAGTQYVDAVASAGPSGVAGIACSLDGSEYTFRSGASARIAVQGLGPHEVRCYATNNAVNSSGTPATSAVQTWNLSIRQPSVSAISFEHIVDALQCHRISQRVRIPAHWVTVTVHGEPVRIKAPAARRVVRVTRCRPKIIHRRVRVGGRWYTETIVTLPHAVLSTSIRVPFGRGATVNGWLGTTAGDAIARETVEIMTEPDSPGRPFAETATAITAANGTWSARLPAGPSRLIEARFAGTPTVEPTISGLVHIKVPASVRLEVHPRATHWGSTIMIRGRLLGCCVPASGEIVVLRIGWKGGSAEIGHVYTRSDGRFSTPYTFLRGSGTETYRIWATTAAESDYPYAIASSRRRSITVGPP